MRLRRPLHWLMLLAAPVAALAQGKPHQHGVAQLNIAVEAKTVVAQFESPLDNLLGFEREPRTEAERRQAGAMVARLEAGAQMLRFDPSAHCRLAGVELRSPVLELGPPDMAASPGSHADIEVQYRFDCGDATRAAYVDVGLFDFQRLQRLQVQLATPAGQFKRDLTRPAQRLLLTK